MSTAPSNSDPIVDIRVLFRDLFSLIETTHPDDPLGASIAALQAFNDAGRQGDHLEIFRNSFTTTTSSSDTTCFNPIQWLNSSSNNETTPNPNRPSPSSSTLEAEETEAVLQAAAAPASAGLPFQIPPNHRDRRFSISAEPYTPDPNFTPSTRLPPKDEDTRTRIKEAVRTNLLFRNLDGEQLERIIDAMVERRVPREVQLIRQGEEGDYFYVIASGSFVVIKDEQEIVRYGPGDTFGELALMYGSPRLATVKALEDSTVWAVDRPTFRSIVIDLAYRKRRLYERFLRSVPLLGTLHDPEIYRICDALQPVHFEAGETIVRQGDIGQQFYIVEEGEAQVVMNKEDQGSNEQVQVSKLKAGDYFGELALLRDAPRAATVQAITLVKCITLTKADFIRLLGPVMPILQRNQEQYRKYEEYLKSH